MTPFANLPLRYFATILADPPWQFTNRTGKVAPEHQRLASLLHDGSRRDPCTAGRATRGAHRTPLPVDPQRAPARWPRGDEGVGLQLQGQHRLAQDPSRRALAPNIVCNPPFDLVRQFITHALKLATGKVAMLMLARRLNAARWLRTEPLARGLPAHAPTEHASGVILSGEKPGGGSHDFAWLVFDRKHRGSPELRWLNRDGVRLPRRVRRGIVRRGATKAT
jgi:hypothetical protein